MSTGKFPPLTKKQLAQLKNDVADLRAAAARKNVTMDSWEFHDELSAAQEHFELGCWLNYYSTRIYEAGSTGLAARIDCARRIFEAGFTQLGYQFFTAFDFGARQFDTIFESGDSKAVLDGLRAIMAKGNSPNLVTAFQSNGWAIDNNLCFDFV